MSDLMSKRLYEDTKRLLEAKDAEIARLTYLLQLAWNTCEEAETNARRLQAENKQLRAALIPFAHPDLMLRLGGNSPSEGDAAIIFQRNNAYLRLRDFDSAFEALKETTT